MKPSWHLKGRDVRQQLWISYWSRLLLELDWASFLSFPRQTRRFRTGYLSDSLLYGSLFEMRLARRGEQWLE